MRFASVVLPEPVLPTIAVVWPGRAVSELDVVELDDALRIRDLHRVVRVAEVDVRVQDRLDAFGGGRGARHHDEDERGHHHREEHEHHVLQEGRKVADLHTARVHAETAEPHDRDGGKVHRSEEERQHDCE